jgi:hypothetical protein
MTFDEYEQKQHEVDMFKMQVQCAICGVLGINAGDTDGSTFHFRRVSDTDIEYHIDYVDGRRKSIDRKLDIKLVELAMEGNIALARDQYLELYCRSR